LKLGIFRVNKAIKTVVICWWITSKTFKYRREFCCMDLM